MIDITELNVSLQGKKILQNITFTMDAGRIIMILGENGSGKTTLIKTLLNWITADSGTIRYHQKDCIHMKEKERAAIFSYVPQIKEIVEDLRVEECIVSGCSRSLSIFAVPGKKDYQRVDDIMKLFDLTHLKGKRLHEISGGELQMIYLARAFAQDGEVMLMDEPCTYLDFRRQHMFLEETKKLTAADKSVLISIHDPNLALQYADEILLLHKGILLAHLKKETHDMKKECCRLYNELYGNHFTLNENDEILIWKENENAANTTICKGPIA